MYPSQPYIKQLRRVHKDARNLSAEQLEARLRDSFGRALRGVPVELVEELFDFSVDRFKDYEGPELVDAFLHTGALVDLFGREYDDRNDPLSEEEWQFIAEVVPDYGLELDMATLEYVMSHLVDRRML